MIYCLSSALFRTILCSKIFCKKQDALDPHLQCLNERVLPTSGDTRFTSIRQSRQSSIETQYATSIPQSRHNSTVSQHNLSMRQSRHNSNVSHHEFRVMNELVTLFQRRDHETPTIDDVNPTGTEMQVLNVKAT